MGRTRAKLPGATVLAALDFRPTDDFWMAVEVHTKQPLGEDQRNELVRIIDRYLHGAQAEHNAPDVKLAEGHLSDLRAAAVAFHNALASRGHNDAELEAFHQVSYLLTRSLEQCQTLSFYVGSPELPKPDEEVFFGSEDGSGFFAPQLDLGILREEVARKLRPLGVERILDLMMEFIWVCGQVSKKLEQFKLDKYWRDGEHWEVFVAPNLEHFWTRLGPDFRASAGRDYASEPSPFVKFVDTLQQHLPANEPGSRNTGAAHKAFTLSQVRYQAP